MTHSLEPERACGDGWRPRAIAFDAFGTLVEIGDKRRPYRRLIRAARRTAGIVDPLTADIPMADWARSMGASAEEIDAAEAELAIEVASIRLRDWVRRAWAGIRTEGLSIAVCSNLATPYGHPLAAALPDPADLEVLSYVAGIRKPDPAIYALVSAGLGLPPEDILFVGDTRTADYDGPLAAGMRALPVETFETNWEAVVGGRRRAPAA